VERKEKNPEPAKAPGQTTFTGGGGDNLEQRQRAEKDLPISESVYQPTLGSRLDADQSDPMRAAKDTRTSKA
jgi:hypothetical protein